MSCSSEFAHCYNFNSALRRYHLAQMGVGASETELSTVRERTSEELHALGLNNQRLVINGVFLASERTDAVACAIEAL